MDTTRDADAIVIGSGMGGLATAAILARTRGLRVLVLERHWRAGGFTHVFSRPGGYRWDVGVHYLGDDVVRPGLARDVFDVTTGGGLSWTRLPETFERLVFPGFEFEIRAGRERFEEDLVRAFPGEAAAIRGYLRDVERVASTTFVLGARDLVPAPVAALLRLRHARGLRLAGRTVREVLETRFRDARLKAILGARWADHGLPPSRASFLPHAVITAHFLGGAYFPEGGAGVIAEGAEPVIAAAGGAIRVRAEVASILVEGGRAAGVRLVDGATLRAPVVVSDAGARTTFLRLVPSSVPIPFRQALAQVPPGLAHVALYLGLSASPAALGVRGENTWIHDDLDHDAIARRGGELLEGRAPGVFLSFPSMKDPRARAHTAEISAHLDGAVFGRWAGTAWRRRGPEYEALKARIADALLAAVERRLPGFGALVAYRELSTPLTTEALTGHPGGEVYGIPFTPARLSMRFCSPRTVVPGLFLTGADALCAGVTGAAMAGLMTAAAVAGTAVFGRLRAAAREVRAARATPSAARPSTAGMPA
jgi:phytoene dehydrogenase-like protein